MSISPETTPSAPQEFKFESEFGLNVEDMAKAGLHLGHSPSKTHPRMKQFIYGVKNGVHLLDLEKSIVQFEAALKFIRELAAAGKKIVLVGGKVQAKALIEQLGKELGLAYVSERWLGGSLTNLKVLRLRIERMQNIRKLQEQGELDKYTKKERLEFEREYNKLMIKFGGIEQMQELPAAVFLCDIPKSGGIIREAKASGVKVIALCDTNADPATVDVAIPLNDDAISALSYILDKVRQAILQGRAQTQPISKE